MRGRTSFLLLLLAGSALSSCSASEDAGESGNDGAPDISPSAAPNVSFRYRYSFALPAERIGAVQEKHAADCEALGLHRCRITGVYFSRDDDDRVRATLSLALEPGLARKFGKDAVAAVEAAAGRLSEQRFVGEDQSLARQLGDESAASARAERERLEREAGRSDLDSKARASLQAQISAQVARQDEAARQQRAVQAVLISAPVDFNYVAERGWSGIRVGSMAMGALYMAGQLLNLLLGLLIILAVVALPLAVAILAAVHLRYWAGRLWKRLAPKISESAALDR